MTFLCEKYKYKFCIITILSNRQHTQEKLCYKKKYKFLNLKQTATQQLSTRLMKRGNYLKIYKVVKKYYYMRVLRDLFHTIPMSSNFMFFFNKYQSFRDFDRVLHWKYSMLDCMFSAKTRKTKKNKKKINTIGLVFITGLKRSLFCLSLLKYVILLQLRRKHKNLNFDYLTPIFSYLMHDRQNPVISLKYKIYKHKLMQMKS